MKKGLLLMLCLIGVLSLPAQEVQQNQLTGRVVDENTKEVVELAAVKVLNIKDSTMVTGKTSGEDGKFVISAKPSKYLVHVSFIGYADKYIDADLTKGNLSLGDILINDEGIDLEEAVVTGRIVEMIIKGDTVEYNADAYKVQESAMLVDLIKRIPGAEIDENGKVTVNGKAINRFLFDGKEFFSSDPKTVSENVPAKMVKSVQVYDKKSDMAQLTGFDDGNEEGVINIVVRDGMRQGTFTNFLGGLGNKDKYEANGFISNQKNDTRITFIGNANNNNGENAGGRGRRGRGGDNGEQEDLMAGININTEFSKWKINGDVSYNGRDSKVESVSSTEYITQPMTEERTSLSHSSSDGVNTRFRVELQIDSMTQLTFRPNLSYSKSESVSSGSSSRSNGDYPKDDFTAVSDNNSKNNNVNLNGTMLFSRKLNNKGRNFAIELSGGLSDGDSDGKNYSLTDYVNDVDRQLLRDQIYDQNNNSYNWGVQASYTEPIGWNNFLELSYNVRGNRSETDKKAYDNDGSGNYDIIAEDYTRNTKNDFVNQNIALSFKSSREKYNYTIGLGVHPSNSKTTVEQPNYEENRITKNNVVNYAPKGEFIYRWDKRHNLQIRYSGSTSQASTNQLYDGIISQTELDTVRGNPNLKPSFRSNMNLRYQKYNEGSGSTFTAGGNFGYSVNDIVSVTKWGEGNSRNTSYANIDGNMNGNLEVGYNTPIGDTRFSFNTRSNGNYSRQKSYYSQRGADPQESTSDSYTMREDLSLKFNSDIIQFDLGGSGSYSKDKFSLEQQTDREVWNYGAFANFTLYLPADIAFESNFNYTGSAGFAAAYQRNIYLWNASISKAFLKDKNATIKFKMYDILQQRSNISRSTNSDNIRYTTTNTINSYFMVNLIYRFNTFGGQGNRPGGSGGGEGRGEFRGGGGSPSGGFGGGGRGRF